MKEVAKQKTLQPVHRQATPLLSPIFSQGRGGCTQAKSSSNSAETYLGVLWLVTKREIASKL